jgi:hypothetical protein
VEGFGSHTESASTVTANAMMAPSAICRVMMLGPYPRAGALVYTVPP